MVSLLVVALIAFEAAYWQKIYPGVTTAGIDLGNLTVAEATHKLTGKFVAQPLTTTWGTASWVIISSQIQLEYNPAQTATQAYQVSRQGMVWQRKTVDPVFSWQENQLQAAIASVSAQINIPAQEPEVQITNGQVVVMPGENGQAVDERQLRQKINLAIVSLNFSPIDIPVQRLQPKLTASQTEQMRQRAEKLLTKQLLLTLDGKQWKVDTAEIMAWLNSNGWNRPLIESWVADLATNIDHPAQNALFKYVDTGKVEEFKPGQEGLVVKQSDLVDGIITNLNQLETDGSTPTFPVPVTTTSPTIQTNQVNTFGIQELIGHGQSDYSGSIPNRIFNLKKAAGSMNGVLVAPGETFSFAKYVGDISAETGYKQAYIIKDGKTILGDGGGVCQVSTTLFRAALNTGLPIVERTAHAYRVHYYEQDSGPGLDATIFTPSVDFKFKNDTPAYLLIQTSVDESKKILHFDLYGTTDGRIATVSKPKVWDVTPPPPDLYTDDPTLPKGTVKQVDFKAWGAKVSFDYKVTRGEEVLQSRTFYSVYRPWQAVYLKGPAQ